jgi:hypothetical protein
MVVRDLDRWSSTEILMMSSMQRKQQTVLPLE